MKRMAFLAAALLTVACMSARMWGPARGIMTLHRQIAQMQQQELQLRRDIEELESAIDSADDRETLELLARRELGLVYPGEIVFYYADG